MKNKRFWWMLLLAAAIGLIIAWAIAAYNHTSNSTLIPTGKVHVPATSHCDSPAYKKTHTEICK